VTEPGASARGRIGRWQAATVVSIRSETATAKTIRLGLPRPSGHLAGQYYVVRLTAPDGYTASRQYSVASAPDGSPEIEITVERLADGEVSPFLTDQLRPGDQLDVRGPIGGWLVWPGDIPALLLGGGSGVVPLMAMLRFARRTGTSNLVRLVVSVRSPEDLYYADELPGPETTIIYTRQAPASETRPPGRLTTRDLPPPPLGGLTYICGSTSFAEAATKLAMETGTRTADIRVERFSPTG
jgi:ferredoxin-NADP reductase